MRLFPGDPGGSPPTCRMGGCIRRETIAIPERTGSAWNNKQPVLINRIYRVVAAVQNFQKKIDGVQERNRIGFLSPVPSSDIYELHQLPIFRRLF